MGLCATLLGCLCALAPAYAQVPDIPGDVDVDDDGFVGLADLNLILGFWNQNVPPADPRADPSGDGFVGIADLNLVLGNWNKGYAPGQDFKGMNLHQVRFWTREWVFVDIMKIADPWRVQNGESGLVTDANDWPTALPPSGVITYMYTGNTGTYPTGRYVCTYDGEGTLIFGDDAQVVSSAPGRIEFDVAAADNGISLKITSTDPNQTGNYARNIKVWMPGFENAQSPFHPLFVKRLRPFSVIRFMDWQRTNNLGEVSWSGRATKDYFSQGTGKGVALEYMIELCNELGASPWFCMPHLGDNNTNGYVENFAKMVRDGDLANNIPPLHDQAKIYVEWSNEVWNSRFPVYDWIREGAIPGPGNDVDLGAPEFFDMWATNMADDFATWHQVYAGLEDKIIRVFASTKDSDNAWVAGKMTDRLKALSFDRQFDAIATSAYFGDDDYTGPTTDGLALINYAMSDTNPVGTIKESEMRYLEHGHLAQQLSIEMGRTIDYLAYEAGQHMTPKDGDGNIKPYSQAVMDAQSHPQMYEAYFKNMQAFKDAGGSLYVAFNYINKQTDIDGGWGHLNHQDQPIEDAHKLRAVLDFPNHE